MLTIMEERENGLGAGYACYGLFPERKDQYCLQLFFDDEEGKRSAEEFLAGRLDIVHDEKVFHKTELHRHASIPHRVAVLRPCA